MGQQTDTCTAAKISVLKTELTTGNCVLLSLQTLSRDDIMNLQMRCYRSTVALLGLENAAQVLQATGGFLLPGFR